MATQTNFSRYVDFKLEQHANAMKRAKRDRSRPTEHARHLAGAATIRKVLAADLRGPHQA